MKYIVECYPQVISELGKMNKFSKTIIVDWIEKNLVESNNLLDIGKPLTEDINVFSIGVYHLLTKVEDNKISIIYLSSGLREYINCKVY